MAKYAIKYATKNKKDNNNILKTYTLSDPSQTKIKIKNLYGYKTFTEEIFNT